MAALNNMMQSFGVRTEEQAQAVLEELAKSERGEYGYWDRRGNFNGPIQKDATNQIGVVTGLGLLGYPLQAPAKLLYPVVTPLRNTLPRQVVGGSTFNFRRITGINTTKKWASVAEAADGTTGRNGRISFNEKDVSLTFKSLETETMLTPEAQYGANSTVTPGQDFQADQFTQLSMLHSHMISEELMLLGGNITSLGTPPTPTKTGITQAATNVGSLTASTTYYVSVSALTTQGYWGGANGQNTGVDSAGETSSVEASIATTAGGNAGDKSLTITWNLTYGAVAYNVFIGSTTGIANHKYVGTYTTNYAYIGSVPSANRPNAADQTANALDFDGLVPNSVATLAGYRNQLPVTASGASTLTADGTGGIAEIDTMFQSFWESYKLGPDKLYVNSAQKKKIDQIAFGSSAPVYRIDATAGDMSIKGSIGVKSLMNRYTGEDVEVLVHPYLAPGTVVAMASNLGKWYPNPNVGATAEVKLAWDYRYIEFAMAKRAREFGIDSRGALAVYAPFCLGAIQNIG
jgi:hypothetical protein